MKEMKVKYAAIHINSTSSPPNAYYICSVEHINFVLPLLQGISSSANDFNTVLV